MKNSLNPINSDFWLDADRYSNYLVDQMADNGAEKVFSMDMIRLASIRKAISNFVRILSRKNIPVYFNDSSDENFNIEGKCIYISASVNNRADFDVSVGQALHEAAHTLKTNFDAVKYSWANIPSHILKLSDNKNIRRRSIEKFIRNIFNVIEDRYIDNYVFTEAPGYRGYYVALYNRFWNCPEIDDKLSSDLFRYPSLDSYDFRITNFTNENTDLMALPRLDEIAKVIDIGNISRLNTTEDRIKVGIDVVEIVLDCLDKNELQASKGNGKKSKVASPEDFFDFGDSEECGKESDNNEDDSGDPNEEPKKPKKDDDKNCGDDEADVDVGKKSVNEISDVITGKDEHPEELNENKDVVSKISGDEISTAEQKELKSIMDKQKDFLNNNFPKEALSSEQKELLDLIEKHGVILVRIDWPGVTAGNDESLKVDCIVVQKMTKELILSGRDIFPLSGCLQLDKKNPPGPPEDVSEAVIKGIVLGTKLGRKLQIRNETNLIKSIRKKRGKIFLRNLHEAAFDAEDLFYSINVDKHNDAVLHITVDASRSMAYGNKWTRTMTAVVAICKATSMVDNVHVTVSFRSTQQAGRECLPYIVLAYDSRTDKFSKVRTIFPYLTPNGATPEGLAFSAIMNLFDGIVPDEKDRYFLNLSDGEPYYSLHAAFTGHLLNYQDEVAVNHTKSQVDKIRNRDVEILSYFIEDYHGILKDSNNEPPENNKLRKNFKKMYGPAAKFVDVENIIDLAKTMNELFLKGR